MLRARECVPLLDCGARRTVGAPGCGVTARARRAATRSMRRRGAAAPRTPSCRAQPNGMRLSPRHRGRSIYPPGFASRRNRICAVTPSARLALSEPCRADIHRAGPTRVRYDRRRSTQSRAGCGHCPPPRARSMTESGQPNRAKGAMPPRRNRTCAMPCNHPSRRSHACSV